MGIVMSRQHPDSVGKVRKILLFEAVFHDSASDCTKLTLEPALLDREQEKLWLNPDLTEPQQILPMLKPYPSETMESWRVPDAAKNPRNDTPEVIQPVSPKS